MKSISWRNYGSDLELILIQFYINPLPVQIEKIPGIERFRPKQKAIGVPLVIDDYYFSLDENSRTAFINNSIINKMQLLKQVIIRNKLDTRIEKLEKDTIQLLNISGI